MIPECKNWKSDEWTKERRKINPRSIFKVTTAKDDRFTCSLTPFDELEFIF